MDKRALILSLDTRRRLRDSRADSGRALTDVKRALTAELREMASSIPKPDDIAQQVLSQIVQPTQPKDGKDGKDGDDGLGFKDAKIDDKHHLILIRDDGKEIDAGELPKGKDGKGGSSVSLSRLRQHAVPTTGFSSVETVTTNTTLPLTASTLLLVDATAGPITITIGLSASCLNMHHIIQKIDTTANRVTVTGDTINNDGDAIITNEDTALHIYSTNSSYGWIIG